MENEKEGENRPIEVSLSGIRERDSSDQVDRVSNSDDRVSPSRNGDVGFGDPGVGGGVVHLDSVDELVVHQPPSKHKQETSHSHRSRIVLEDGHGLVALPLIGGKVKSAKGSDAGVS